MPSVRPTRAAFAVLLSLPLLLSACREDAIIGTSLAPIDDSLNTVTLPEGSVSVIAYSVYDDSAETAFREVGSALIGTSQGVGVVSSDPYAGRVTAGLYFSVVPPSGGFSIDTVGLKIDSAFLVLPYAGFAWGDTSSSTPGQRWSVYQVTEDLLPGTPYRSNQSLATSPTKLGSALVYKSDYAATRTVDGAIRPPHLRMRLDTPTLFSVLRSDAGDLGSAAGMRKKLKGFYIAADEGQTAATLAYFRFSASTGLYERPAMHLYYHTPASTSSQAVFPFSVDSSAAFTRVQRFYGGSPAYNVLFGGAGIRPQDQLLLQSKPGAAIDVKLGGLSRLPKTVYPKVQLILTKLDTAQSDRFFEPARIFPDGVDNTGATYTILDFSPATQTAPLAFVDGSRRTATIGGVTVTQYVVNVPREFQSAVLAGKDTLHLRLNGATGRPGAYRLIAGGTAHGRWYIRTSVAYSRQ